MPWVVDTCMILDVLEDREDGFLPLHDKSPPDDIRRQLGMSKKTFNFCLMDAGYNIMWEGKVLNQPDAIFQFIY